VQADKQATTIKKINFKRHSLQKFRENPIEFIFAKWDDGRLNRFCKPNFVLTRRAFIKSGCVGLLPLLLPAAHTAHPTRRPFPRGTTAFNITPTGNFVGAGEGFLFYGRFPEDRLEFVAAPELTGVTAIVRLSENEFIIGSPKSGVQKLRLSPKYEIAQFSPRAGPNWSEFSPGNPRAFILADSDSFCALFGHSQLRLIQCRSGCDPECISLVGTLRNYLPPRAAVLGHCSSEGKWAAFSESRAILYLLSYPHRIDHQINICSCASACWRGSTLDILQSSGNLSRWQVSQEGKLKVLHEQQINTGGCMVSIHSLKDHIIIADSEHQWYEIIQSA
jgi:hypothetical protein